MAVGAPKDVGNGHLSPGSDSKERVLALVVRPRKIGFVIFEGLTRLLDWGVRNYPGQQKQAPAVVARRIASLLELYAPSNIVLWHRFGLRSKSEKTFGRVADTIRVEARRHSLKVDHLSARAVQRFFALRGWKTKYQIASALAERYDELKWKLPPKRRPWQAEHYSMLIFDAAAVGVAFFGTAVSSEGAVQP